MNAPLLVEATRFLNCSFAAFGGSLISCDVCPEDPPRQDGCERSAGQRGVDFRNSTRSRRIVVNSLKSFFMLLVLVGVGYGVYRTLHLKKPSAGSPGVDTSIPAMICNWELAAWLESSPGGTAQNSTARRTPPRRRYSRRVKPRRDNIVNAPFAQPSTPAAPSATTPPAPARRAVPLPRRRRLGFGEPAAPTPRGNDLKLRHAPAGDNPGSALLPPLAATPKTGPGWAPPPQAQ